MGSETSHELFSKLFRRPAHFKSAKKLFKLFDKDHNGCLGPDECFELAIALMQHFNNHTENNEDQINIDDPKVKEQAHRWVDAILTAVDENKDNTLSLFEFTNVFMRIDYVLSLSKYDKETLDLIKNCSMKDLINGIQDNQSGNLSEDTKNNIRGIFAQVDKDGNGFIEQNELSELSELWIHTSSQISGQTSSSESEKLAAKWLSETFLSEGDIDHDGRLSLDEMMGIMKNISVVMNKFIEHSAISALNLLSK